MAPRRARRGRVAAARPARRVGHQGSTRHRAARGADSLRGPVLPRRLAPKTPGAAPGAASNGSPARPRPPRATAPAASSTRAAQPGPLVPLGGSVASGPPGFTGAVQRDRPPSIRLAPPNCAGPPNCARPPGSTRPPRCVRPPRLRAPHCPAEAPRRAPSRPPSSEVSQARRPRRGPPRHATRRRHTATPTPHRPARRHPPPRRRAGQLQPGRHPASHRPRVGGREPGPRQARARQARPAGHPAGPGRTGPDGTGRAEPGRCAGHAARASPPRRRPPPPRAGGGPAAGPRAPSITCLGPKGRRYSGFWPAGRSNIPASSRPWAARPPVAGRTSRPGARVTDNRGRDLPRVRRPGRPAAGPRPAEAVVQRQVPVG